MPAADDVRAGHVLPYVPALDGIRALAVAGVLAYHTGVGWLPGGFLGVDVFFVLSGFLITSLLLAERRATGRIDLRAFWLRRARRLLPAAFLVIGASVIAAALLAPGDLARTRADALASFVYANNWHRSWATTRTSRRSSGRRCCCTSGRWPSRSSSTSCGRSRWARAWPDSDAAARRGSRSRRPSPPPC
jgi:Acyltransferase family